MSAFAFDRVLKLTHGRGNGIDAACLMTASNMLIGRGADGDQNGCVCPIITAFIIPTNDSIPERFLGELYGPLLYEILGTRTDDWEVMRRRAYVFVDWVFRTAWPLYLRELGCEKEAVALESLDEIVDGKTAGLAALAARAGLAARAALATRADLAALADRAGLADLAALAALADLAALAALADLAGLAVLADLAGLAALAARAGAAGLAALADLAARAGLADLAALAARAGAADLAALAARAARATRAGLADLAALAALAALAVDLRSAREKIWRSCPDVIRRAAAIGDRRPVETCMTLPELCEKLG